MDKNIILIEDIFAETPFTIVFESRNFRGIKNRGLKRVNSEMIRVSITYNLKKIRKHMSNYVLKKILHKIRDLKRTQEVKIDILKEWPDKLVFVEYRIVDIEF